MSTSERPGDASEIHCRLKEHKDACIRCQTDTESVIAEHAWSEDHPINWSGTKILQRTSHTMELVMKEARAYSARRLTLAHFNRDTGYAYWLGLDKICFFSCLFAFLLCSGNLPILLFLFTNFALSFTHFAFQKFLFYIL